MDLKGYTKSDKKNKIGMEVISVKDQVSSVMVSDKGSMKSTHDSCGDAVMEVISFHFFNNRIKELEKGTRGKKDRDRLHFYFIFLFSTVTNIKFLFSLI